ncbi:hypothetical protein [Kribbella jiaozuonensis]|uniref:Uncharacterized protein n=1 Tax=Kribbella jiaozuonensis TaxID=2575441 RepID=A0A4U3LYM2_9ACTN|nr:hypothetical protein [Kribbella jiaozuonensis]TKK80026.1 hypothetical protein FDA38_16905 [Kribbella jiaozuonensis]
MTDLYPSPPHLTIAVWVASDDELAFGQACDTAIEFGCTSSGVVEIAPRGRAFAMLQDLEDRSTEHLSGAEFDSMVHGAHPMSRPLKAGFRRKGIGTVIVEHLLGTATEPHPVAISLSAGALGWPEELSTAKDRKAAYRLAVWATDVLRDLTARTGALYGSIAVEETLPTPTALSTGTPLSTQPFLSTNLPPAVLRAFQAACPQSHPTPWPHGTFFPFWKPFPAANRSALTTASTTLGHALQRRTHEL